MNGSLIIIVGPSAGAGKTTVVHSLLERTPRSARVVTTTTRPPRPGEVSGVDYFFVNSEEFEQRRVNGDLLEWEQPVEGRWYGTSRERLSKCRAESCVAFLIIDARGAASVKRAYPESLIVYIKPDSIENLENRLLSRSGMTKEEICSRLAKVPAEMREIEALPPSLTVINREGHIEETIGEIETWIKKNVFARQTPR